MRVTFISDTHCRHRMISLPGGDLLVFSGDFMSDGYNEMEIQDFIKWLKDLNYTYKVCIAGNHDRYCEACPVEVIKNKFEEYYDDGVRYISDEMIEIYGLKIYGTPYQPYFCNWAFNVSDSNKLYEIYKTIPDNLDILITHCPPYDILDKSHQPRPYYGRTGEEPLGSDELKKALSELNVKPRYHVFGHIHGDGGKIVEENGTKFINASVCDEAYQPVNDIITLDIN